MTPGTLTKLSGKLATSEQEPRSSAVEVADAYDGAGARTRAWSKPTGSDHPRETKRQALTQSNPVGRAPARPTTLEEHHEVEDLGWIHHLGLNGTRGSYDKASVAIEFANEGPLTLDGDRLHAFGMNTPDTVYTGLHFTSDWRGHKWFAEMDEPQVDAGIELTLDICRRHDIDPVFYYPSTTYDFPRCFQVATIVCHSNCRTDKADLFLPDWVFQKIEAAGIRRQS